MAQVQRQMAEVQNLQALKQQRMFEQEQKPKALKGNKNEEIVNDQLKFDEQQREEQELQQIRLKAAEVLKLRQQEKEEREKKDLKNSSAQSEIDALTKPINFEKLANEDLNECMKRLEQELKKRYGQETSLISFEDEGGDSSVTVTLHYLLRASTIKFPKLKIFQCQVSCEAPLKVVASALATENGDPKEWKNYLFFKQNYDDPLRTKEFQRMTKRD